MKRSSNNYNVKSCGSGILSLWRLLLTTSFIILVLAPWARAQVTLPRVSDANMTDAERRESTLLWLNKFLTESDLMRQEDVDKIRQAVLQMSSSQLERWLEQTKQLRAYVEGERWQQTKRWLREFLRVQAIYNEQEIQQLRDDIVRADADQMLAIMKRIQAKYDSLVWMQQASERNRQVEVEEREAYVASQAAAATAARASSAGTLPLVGGAMAAPQGGKPSVGYMTPVPLVDSRTMARAAVWTELWGPGWLIGF